MQRVLRAQVKVRPSGKVAGKIGKGVFILVGVGVGDDMKRAKILAEKVAKLRIISDENDKMNLSISETESEVLVVSQFTLYADTTKGNRPSFVKAVAPKRAEKIFDEFVNNLKDLGLKVQTGEFGAYMEIETICDGPVTILIET